MSRQPQNPCPTCHGFARVQTPDKQIACARCGTILPPLPFAQGRSPVGVLSHTTPIRVGMTARIGGKEYHNVGRIRYAQSEDGETYYWEEWVLLNPDGDVRYLEYDEGKWTLSAPFEPRQAPSEGILATISEGNSYPVDSLTVTVTDAGTCRVQAVEGEIPWPIQKGDQLRYVDMEGGGGFYSAELPGDGTAEWFRGQRLDSRAVYALFDLREMIAHEEKRDQARQGRRFFGIVCLLAGLTALLGWGCSGSRAKVVAQDSVVVSQIGPEGVRKGPYHLSAVGRVHRLRVSSSLTQTSTWVQAVLEDDTAGELFDVTGDLWDESGTDSDGAWHEYDLHSQSDFRLARAGNVYVRLYAEPEAAARSAGAPVSFVIEQGVLYPTYLATFGIVSVIVGGLFFATGSKG